MDDNVQVCPNCGNPMQEENISANMDKEVLAQGASTKAESTISSYANAILIFGRIAAVCVGIVSFFLMINSAVEADAIILAFIIPFIMALSIWWTSKLLWAAIMLFVNISTTLKRIEKKMEKYGTN